MHPIPRVTPALSIDIVAFLEPEPFDGTSQGDLWTVVDDFDYTYIQTNTTAWESLFAPYFDSEPWADGAPNRTLEVDWSDTPGATWEQMFDPGDRWSGAYACE
jgi:hypothetical protein